MNCRGYLGPEEIALLVAAYEEALARLQLANNENETTRLVARRIISLALAGERDPVRLCERAVKQPLSLAADQHAMRAAWQQPEPGKGEREKRNTNWRSRHLVIAGHGASEDA
jgi:hypothetical protein